MIFITKMWKKDNCCMEKEVTLACKKLRLYCINFHHPRTAALVLMFYPIFKEL